MDLRSGRKAQLEREQLRAAAGVDTVALDRLAIAVSLSSNAPGERAGRDPRLDDADGAVHDLTQLDDFDGVSVFRWVVGSKMGRRVSGDDYAAEIRRHLNRGYDVLYRTYERAEKDWLAVLEHVSPKPSRVGNTGRGVARPIRLAVGHDLLGGQDLVWRFNLEGRGQTNSNVRIAGMPGTGKSQFLLDLLYGIAEQSPDTGFILFDYKGDLATNDAFVRMTGARVLRPGVEAIPINPFQLPDTVSTQLAPRALAETFRALGRGIGPVQESLLVKAMTRCYANSDRPAGKEDSSRAYPTLGEIVSAVERIYAEEDRQEDSVLAILRDLTAYNLFADDCETPLPRVFAVRWIVDLAQLPTLRDFVAFVLLEFLHQVARSLEDAAFEVESELRQVRGVVAIDEAHYYLKARCRPLLDLIRVGRSKGVPVFLSSQSLEDFRGYTEVNEFLANTFVLKHGVPPEKKIVAGALHVDLNQAAAYSTQTTALEKFQAFVSLAEEEDGLQGVQKAALHGFWERTRR